MINTVTNPHFAMKIIFFIGNFLLLFFLLAIFCLFFYFLVLSIFGFFPLEHFFELTCLAVFLLFKASRSIGTCETFSFAVFLIPDSSLSSTAATGVLYFPTTTFLSFLWHVREGRLEWYRFFLINIPPLVWRPLYLPGLKLPSAIIVDPIYVDPNISHWKRRRLKCNVLDTSLCINDAGSFWSSLI